MFSTQIPVWAYFVCLEGLDIVLIRLDCGFLFQGLKIVSESEGRVANVNAQKNLAIPSVRELTWWGLWQLGERLLLSIWLLPVGAVRVCGLKVVGFPIGPDNPRMQILMPNLLMLWQLV